MDIPKKIDRLIDKRKRLAQELIDADYELTKYIEDNNLNVEQYDYCGGCEMYVNPVESANRIRQAIIEKDA